MVDINDYTEEKSCIYKGEEYIVRDNGAIMRKTRLQKKKRAQDEVWTFGKRDSKNGYMLFCSERVHRIVATAFHGEPPTQEHVVDHIDTNRINNRPSNLRWLTRLENVVFNEITRKKIEFITGVSISEFLENPKLYRDKFAQGSHLGWMRQVTEDESKACLENFKRLGFHKSSALKVKSVKIGEWIYNQSCPDIVESFDDKTDELYVKKSKKTTFLDSLTPNAKQKDWRTPTEFPLCPSEIGDSPIVSYFERISEGAVFSSNRYGDSRIKKFVLTKTNSILLIAETSNGVKPYALTEITFDGECFIHESKGSFFHEDGAEEFFAISQGLEWTGEHSFDYYCS